MRAGVAPENPVSYWWGVPAAAGSAPAASASQGTGVLPGQGGGPAGQGGAVGGQGSGTQLELVGKVAAVGPGTITVTGGPVQSVTADVTSSSGRS
jgi:hypothetical protein